MTSIAVIFQTLFLLLLLPSCHTSEGRKRQEEVNADLKTTVKEFKAQITNVVRLPVNRIRLFLGEGKNTVVLADDKTLGDYAEIKAGATVNWKDLGPQIGWTTVFVIEYLGPLVIYPLFVLPAVREIVYGKGTWPVSQVQTWALAAWVFHYVKRELETLFVHKFSKDTMPLLNLWKNSSYYWGCAAAVSYFVNHPQFTAPPLLRSEIAFAAFVLFEVLNGITHLQLSNLRAAGKENKYVLPHGLWWDFITCPNYTFEILSWLSFSIATQTLTAYLFTLMGFVQMLEWAKGKYRRYVKEFPEAPGKPRNEVFNKRKALIFPPFL